MFFSVIPYLFSMRSFSFLLVPMVGGLQQEYRNESQPERETVSSEGEEWCDVESGLLVCSVTGDKYTRSSEAD